MIHDEPGSGPQDQPDGSNRHEHPAYPVSDWQDEVANDDTRLGYWDWVIHAIRLAVAARVHQIRHRGLRSRLERCRTATSRKD